MGRSTSSCFQIMSCNGGAADGDDLSPESQSKPSSEKRRWSFRKKSSSHRVLSNNAISESLSVGSSKGSEGMTNNLQSPKYSSVSEKAPSKERPTVTFLLPEAIVKPDEEEYTTVSKKNIPSFQESDAIIIQAYIRGYLARKKLKSAIKLQAVVRGHLVRRQAVGTLRCVLAIFKMQAFVRAHQARQLAKKGKENSYVKSHNSLLSTEKLLSNGFVRQLLESSSTTKAINIKCDPSKSDAAWKWLERWMAVVTSDSGEQQEQLLNKCFLGVEEKELGENVKGDGILDAIISLPSDVVLVPNETAMQTDKMSLTAEDFGNSGSKDPFIRDHSVNSSVKDVVNSLVQDEDLLSTHENHTKTGITDDELSNSLTGDYQLQESDQTLEKIEMVESTSPKGNAKIASEILDLEGKKHPHGSRRLINPAFAAVQSKFEELSSTYSVSRSNGSSYQDTSVKIKSENHSDHVDSITKSKDTSYMESAVFHDPRVQVAASECGTEISISSTLDSPDRSETEGREIVLEIGALEKEKYSINTNADSTLIISNKESKENNSNRESDVCIPQALLDQDGNLGKSISAPIDQSPTEQTPDRHTHLESVTDEKVRTSPPGTPRSQTTASDFHGTPSSQVSVNTVKSKKDSNLSTQRQRSLLGGKKSPANSGNDSGGKSSIEQLPKNASSIEQLPKNAKRRNSVGMAKSDSVDQEPRLSSSNSLPSYMQATVSARAKLHANISPKLSPDVHDSNSKKRHSLPNENGKQGSSPRMQRSASQAQQNSKVNGTHSPHNVAERRWQR